MAIPLLAAIGLLAGGMGASYMGQKRADNAREAAFVTERLRQMKMQREQDAKFADSVREVEEFAGPERRQQAADARMERYQAATDAAPAAGLPGSSSAPKIVADASEKAQAGAAARTTSLASALAALGGTGDALMHTNIAMGRNAQEIDQLHGFKMGSMGVLDAEMKAAAHKGSFLRGIGGLAQSIGQMALMGHIVPGGADKVAAENPWGIKGAGLIY